MFLNSHDFPQADRLESVLLAIIAVGQGAESDIDIANSIPQIHGDSRQGRYYRKAAELLGFITNYRNKANLTVLGRELLKNPSISNPLFINSVIGLKIYQRLIPYLEIYTTGLTRDDIEKFLESIFDPNIGPSMIPRRLSTILNWLQTLGFLALDGDRYSLIKNFNSDLPLFELRDIEQPILPKTGGLTEYEDISHRVRNAIGEVSYYKNLAKQERSNNAHIQLVNMMAARVRNCGGLPTSNQLIDLAVNLDKSYIFEIKSTVQSNERAQIRRGLSQLYEYRYLCLPDDMKANLVLVVENELNPHNSWMIDYLENDRQINVIWDGNHQLNASERTRKELSFLW